MGCEHYEEEQSTSRGGSVINSGICKNFRIFYLSAYINVHDSIIEVDYSWIEHGTKGLNQGNDQSDFNQKKIRR